MIRPALALALVACTPPGPESADPRQLALVLPDGARAGTEQSWATTNANHEHHATVAWLPDATLAIAFTRMAYGPTSVSYVQLADNDGVVVPGTLTQLYPTGFVAKPDVIADPDGRVWVATENMRQSRMNLERLDLVNAVTERRVIATGNPQTQGNNSIDLTRLASGETLATWYAAPASGGGTGRYWHARYDDTLTLVAGPTQLASVAAHGTAAPDAAALPDGFAIAWVDEVPAPSLRALVLTTFAGSPPVRGATVTLYDDPASTEVRPALDANSRGELAVSWNDYRAGAAVAGHVLFTDGAGTPLLPEFAPAAGPIDDVVVRFLGDDHVMAAWMGVPAGGGPAQVSFAVYEFPGGAEVVPPTVISDPLADASRPALSVRLDESGEWQVAASWESRPAGALRDVRGLVLWFTL